MADGDYEVGYGKPPRSTQFRKSGNPANKRKAALPYDLVLGRRVWLTEDGKTRRVYADEAFLTQLVNRGIITGGQIRQLARDAMELSRKVHKAARRRVVIYTTYAEIGDVEKPMRWLGMATLLDARRESARLVIEPWVVEAALARLGDQRLSFEQQRLIVDATRKPSTVKWPIWWTVFTT